MVDFPLLSLMTFLPILGAFFIFIIRGEDDKAVAEKAKRMALFSSIFTFCLSIFMCVRFDPNAIGFQFEEHYDWFPTLGITFRMGVDGISLFFIMLSSLLTPVCILASWKSIQKRVKEYMVAFLVLESFMIGTFTSLDAILFYVFFEGVLIPMYLIIGVWGGERRVYSAYKFFLFTLAGSVLMLIGLLTLYFEAGTTDIPELIDFEVPLQMQVWIWLAFFASFAVKMPMWPVHTWLPDAHVEAPTAGSIILAGVLLKMGGYGFIRFSIAMLPEASAFFAPMVFWLSVIAIVYTSLVALVQTDMKKLIAYSSVAHMGFVTLGLFTFNIQGMTGAVFQMLSHGIISGALFLCVGVVYDRLHTREISRYGGLVQNMPRYAVVFMMLMLGSVGLPGTSGFVGEFLTLVGLYQEDKFITLLAGTGVVLGAAYMLWLYRKVVFGAQCNEDAASMKDLDVREFSLLVPLVALVIWFGVSPGYILSRVEPAVKSVTLQYQAARLKSGIGGCGFFVTNFFNWDSVRSVFERDAQKRQMQAAPVPSNGIVGDDQKIDFDALKEQLQHNKENHNSGESQ